MVDREADAAETPAEAAVQVEKPEVQPGGGYRGDAFEHEASFAGFALRPRVKAIRAF
jgi:hypothetical protein